MVTVQEDCKHPFALILVKYDPKYMDLVMYWYET